MLFFTVTKAQSQDLWSTGSSLDKISCMRTLITRRIQYNDRLTASRTWFITSVAPNFHTCLAGLKGIRLPLQLL